jgi:plastocyanin
MIDKQLVSMCKWLAVAAMLVIPASARAQWNAKVGAQSKDLGHQALAFLPNEIWIHAGESVTWTMETDEIHTVTFLKTAPPPSQPRPIFQEGCPGFAFGAASFDGTTCVSTPPLAKGQTFTVSFPKAGNFKLVCLVHENMTGVVHVLDLALPLPHSQRFYDDKAADERKDLLLDRDGDGDGEQGDSMHEHSGRNLVTAGIGEVVATAGGSDTLSVLRFMQHDKVIHAGQTIEWTNQDPVTPHTITFGTEPANPVPPSGPVTMDADGALHATINAVGDSVHSGFLIAAPQERIGLPQSPITPTRFRITFTHAGTYPYICALHDTLGMKGKIVVLP